MKLIVKDARCPHCTYAVLVQKGKYFCPNCNKIVVAIHKLFLSKQK